MTVKELMDKLALLKPDKTIYVYLVDEKPHWPECDASGRYGIDDAILSIDGEVFIETYVLPEDRND